MQNSKIEWCDHTFNPWHGCLKVSPGCEHCYAETFSRRLGRTIWGPAKTTGRMLMSEGYWKQPIKWNRAAEAAGVRAKVFCASMADVFEEHPGVVEARARLFTLIESTPHLDWLLLTKRPENIDQMLPLRWSVAEQGMPCNVWLGFSAEDQRRFDERWVIMEWTKRMWHPSVVFLSAEPLLGPLDISDALQEIDLGDDDHSCWSATLDWVIVGGESGHDARPVHPDWARGLRRQCAEAGVPFFFKQWGQWLPMAAYDPALHGLDTDHWKHGWAWRGQPHDPDDLPMSTFNVGKGFAGRLLDDQEWNEVPE